MTEAKRSNSPARACRVLLLAAALGSAAMAQSPLADPFAAKPEPAEQPVRKKGSTTVTAEKEATFDNAARQASFSGNVKVTDPEFQLTCDNLVVYLSDDKAPAKPGGSASALSKAVADGNVVVIQQRTTDAGDNKVYRGKAEHGVYDAVTEEFVLTGWPQVQQGFNSHIATEQGTVMTIRKDGQMVTKGGSRTEIQESPDEP